MGDVWIHTTDPGAQAPSYRSAEYEEKGEIVITAPYPYLTRTLWGDVEGFEASLRSATDALSPPPPPPPPPVPHGAATPSAS